MKYFFLLCLLVAGKGLHAELAVVPKFIYVLHGGVDSVWGQYMFMVRNESQETQRGKFTVALPEQTVDWQAQQGFEGIQFSLGEQGGLSFAKDFEAGDNIHTVGFKTLASGGQGELSLVLPQAVAELSFMTTGDVSIEGPGLRFVRRSEGQRYDKYFLYDLNAGQRIKLQVLGVPKGRMQFWLFAWAAAVALFLGAGTLAYVTRPSIAVEGSR